MDRKNICPKPTFVPDKNSQLTMNRWEITQSYKGHPQKNL